MATVWLDIFLINLIKVWSIDQQHQPYLGACEKCRLWGPSPDLMSQNMYFNKIPSDWFSNIKV